MGMTASDGIRLSCCAAPGLGRTPSATNAKAKVKNDFMAQYPFLAEQLMTGRQVIRRQLVVSVRRPVTGSSGSVLTPIDRGGAAPV